MSAQKELRALYVEPGKYPREIKIPYTQGALQECVCGYFDICYPWSNDHACVVCNGEAKLNSMEPNRLYGKYDYLAGPFLVCGFRGENLISLTDEQISRYEKMYHFPQIIWKTQFGVHSVKCTPEQYAECMGKNHQSNKNEIEQERE